MNRVLAFAATGGFGLALVSALGVLLAPLGYRLGVWDVRFALLTLVKWATIASLEASWISAPCRASVAAMWA